MDADHFNLCVLCHVCVRCRLSRFLQLRDTWCEPRTIYYRLSSMTNLKVVVCLLLGWTASALSTITRIQVCQNKDCCLRFQGRAANLVQTLRQITTLDVPIEPTGCLSHCDKGEGGLQEGEYTTRSW